MTTETSTVPSAPEPTRRATRLAHKVAINSAAQAFRQIFLAAAGILSVALSSRYLSLDQYGQVIAATVIVSLFSVAGDFGITATAARTMAREPTRRDAIAAAALWTWTAFTSLAAVAVVAMTMLAYAGPEHEITRQAVLIILFGSSILAPLAGVASATAVVEQRVWLQSLGTVAARALALGMIVAAIVFDLGPLGIASGFAIGFLLDGAFSILLIRPRMPFTRPDRVAIAALIGAAVPLGLVMLVNSLYFKLDALLLTLLGSTRDVAVYGVAYRAFEVLLALPGFVMITLLPELARLAPESERFVQIVQKALNAMCLLVAPLLGIALLGPEGITFLGGEKYSEGGLVLSLVLVAVATGCIDSVFGNTLVAVGRQGVLLKISVLNLTLNGAMNLVAIPLWGARGAAGALCVSELISLLLTMLVYRKISPLPRLERPLRYLLALVAMCLAMSVRFLLPDDEMAGRLVVAIGVGIPVYLGALIALRAIPPYVVEPAVAAFGALRRKVA